MVTRRLALRTASTRAAVLRPPPPQSLLTAVLSRQIGDEAGLVPDHLPQQAVKPAGKVLERLANLRGEVLRFPGISVEAGIDLAGPLRRHLLHGLFQQLLHRHRQWALPEPDEARLRLGHRRPHHQDVPVTEGVLLVEIVILVGHVAAAGDPHHAVEQGGLVVHPLVHGAEAGHHVGEPLHLRGSHGHLRVIDPDVDVGVTGQGQERLRRRVDEEVIHQHPHPYPPLRGPE